LSNPLKALLTRTRALHIGALGAAHLRDVFYRMGFDDREIVALSGAGT